MFSIPCNGAPWHWQGQPKRETRCWNAWAHEKLHCNKTPAFCLGFSKKGMRWVMLEIGERLPKLGVCKIQRCSSPEYKEIQFANSEQWGWSGMTDKKTWMTDQTTGHENAGHENARQKLPGFYGMQSVNYIQITPRNAPIKTWQHRLQKSRVRHIQ